MKSKYNYFILILTSLIISGCVSTPTRNQIVSFSELPGWEEQQIQSAKPALVNSCKKLRRASFSNDSTWGSYSQWQSLCQELNNTPGRQLKSFFEHNFKPIQIAPNQDGLYTGYYSPVILGSMTSDKTFPIPLRALPADLVSVRLSDFGVPGDNLIGEVEGGFLKPYKDRAKIEQQIATENDVLLWLSSAEDKFFLQIQGSGNIQLQDGRIVHVGYAGNNGQNYVAIGRVLKNAGELKNVSMQTIQQWLADNPDKQQWLFNQNPRYIFFRENNDGAITSQGIPATARRTLAVDNEIIPLGIPVWLDTTLTATGEPFRQLMVAQDTGSAIKGYSRGDIYLGIGDEAAALAGKQKSPGKMYVLVPR